MFIDLAGLHEFVRVHHRKWKWSEALTLVLAFFPYQWLLGIGAIRALLRQMVGASNWEKTAHIGQHKAISPGPQPLAPSPPVQPWQPAAPGQKPASRMTLVRTANFFVHAFAPGAQADALAVPGAPGSPLDRRTGWAAAERQRLLRVTTRLLPRRETFTLSHLAQQREIPLPGWLEGLVVVLILGGLLAFQALSVFHAPYTSDEGTLMANAQAILQGKITPYTYDYSQPPLGWILIAGWVKLTGGIASFGNAINSGRVLMLVLAGASSLLLYLLTSRLSGSRSAALLAAVLYTLSPLSLLYRDQVLPYNIAMFWLLLSLWLVTNSKSRLGTFALAAAALGIAILSDGMFLVFLPVMVYAVSLYATSFQQQFSKVAFAYVALAVSSVYVLLALLKGEFLPSGDPLAHPSLLGTFLPLLGKDYLPSGNLLADPGLIGAFFLKSQVPLADQQSSAIWQAWLQTDLLFIAGGTAAILLNILGGTVNRFRLLAALLGVTYWVVLIVNNVWYPYSIVPLLPFLALNIALAVNAPLRWLTRHVGFDLARAFLLFVMVGMLVPSEIQYAQPLLATNGSEPQQQAMTWVRDNVPRDAVIIANSYMYADLLDPQGMAVGGGTPFTKAQIYTNAALDPAIAAGKLNDQWQTIDFLVVDPGMLKEIRTDRRFILLNEALHHAVLRVSFGSSQEGTQIQIYQVIRQT
jgi:4-amino-4-deoxy-L-arabinose transferase-like glycosyltransferase